MTRNQAAPELLPCPIGCCPSLKEAASIKRSLDNSPMAIKDERVAVYLNDYEKQALRKILWHYRTNHTRAAQSDGVDPTNLYVIDGKGQRHVPYKITGDGELATAHYPGVKIKKGETIYLPIYDQCKPGDDATRAKMERIMTKTYKAGDVTPDGWIYLARINGEVILVAPKDEEGLFTWDDALAKFTLPKRHEWIMIYEAKDQGAFKGSFGDNKPYWSARRYDGYHAYIQWFDDGNQNLIRRTLELVVRPVRRISTQAFNDLLEETDYDLQTR